MCAPTKYVNVRFNLHTYTQPAHIHPTCTHTPSSPPPPPQLPDGRHVVSAIAFLATLFTPHTTTTSPPQETVPSSAFATDSTHADTPTPTSSGTAEQGAPSKEDVLVLQQACVLAVHAVQAYVGIAAAGGGHGMCVCKRGVCVCIVCVLMLCVVC